MNTMSMKREWIKSGAYRTVSFADYQKKVVDSWFVKNQKDLPASLRQQAI